MGQKFYDESDVQSIANAIRSKNSAQNIYTVSQMAAAIAAIPTGVTSCIIATHTCTSAKGNQNVTLISNNAFIAQNYNDSKAFALVVKTSNLLNNGIVLFFNTNQQFGVLSTSNSTPVYGWFGGNNGTVTGSANRITTTLDTVSTTVGHMYATANGDLVVRAGSTGNAFQTGDYFIIFGFLHS